MEPVPGGFRRQPPGICAEIGLSQGPEEVTVFVALAFPWEKSAFIRWFELFGWTVIEVCDDRLAGCYNIGAKLNFCLTDSMMTLRKIGEQMPVVFVADESVTGHSAMQAGADWIVLRPIDLTNPLGF